MEEAPKNRDTFGFSGFLLAASSAPFLASALEFPSRPNRGMSSIGSAGACDVPGLVGSGGTGSAGAGVGSSLGGPSLAFMPLRNAWKSCWVCICGSAVMGSFIQEGVLACRPPNISSSPSRAGRRSLSLQLVLRSSLGSSVVFSFSFSFRNHG